MAKIKFTAVVADMRGKLAGSVFSKNRGGAYVRTKVTPVNPNTTAQATVREIFTNLAQAFRNLTPEQITAWNAAVDNFKGTDIFGDIKRPSGINLFQRLNLNLVNAGIAMIFNPPLPSEVATMNIASVAFDTGDGTCNVTFSEANVPADHTLIISGFKPLSPGVNFTSKEGSKLTKADAGVVAPANIYASYVAKYGVPAAGTKIVLTAKTVNNLTGLTSGVSKVSCLVSA